MLVLSEYILTLFYMVYKNTYTQILTLLYGICKFIKMRQKQVFYVMKMKFIDVCLIVIKNEKKKVSLNISI